MKQRSIFYVRAGALIAVLAVLVHMDWHVGRAIHHGLSLGWTYHWIVGVVGLGGMALLALRWRLRLAALVAVVVAGLAAGQVLEPWLETVLYGLSWSEVMPVERWRVFLEFTLAGVLGLSLVQAVAYVVRRVRHEAGLPKGA